MLNYGKQKRSLRADNSGLVYELTGF